MLLPPTVSPCSSWSDGKKMRSKHQGLPYPSAIPPLYTLALNMKDFFLTNFPSTSMETSLLLHYESLKSQPRKNQWTVYPQGMKNSIHNQSVTCFSGPGKYSKGHPFNPLHGWLPSGISRSRLTAKDCQKGVKRSRIIISGSGAR